MILKLKYSDVIAGVMVASAFIGGGYSLFSIGDIEMYPLRILTILIFPLVISRLLRSRLSLIPCYLSSWVILGTLAWGLISLIWSPDSLLGARTFLIILTSLTVLNWVVAYINLNDIKLVRILGLWCLFSLITSAIGYYELITGSYFVSNISISKMDSIERVGNMFGWIPPRAFTGNWNNFGFTNALSFFLMLGVAISPATKKIHKMATLSTILLFGLVLSSASRAAVGGVFFGILIFLFLAFPGGLGRIFSKGFIFSGVAFAGLILFSNYINNISGMIDVVLQKNEDFDGLGPRAEIYSKAIFSLVDSYGLGSGLGSSTVIIDGGSYHHHFIEILAELGVGVFAAHLFLHLIVFWFFVKNVRHPKWGGVIIALASGTAVLPILCTGPSSIIGEALYWLWLGIAVSVASIVSVPIYFRHKQIRP